MVGRGGGGCGHISSIVGPLFVFKERLGKTARMGRKEKATIFNAIYNGISTSFFVFSEMFFFNSLNYLRMISVNKVTNKVGR